MRFSFLFLSCSLPYSCSAVAQRPGLSRYLVDALFGSSSQNVASSQESSTSLQSVSFHVDEVLYNPQAWRALSNRSEDAPPDPYDVYDFFSFVDNFPSDPVNKQEAIVMITNTLIAVQLVLSKSIFVVQAETEKQEPTNPSCLRYFFKEDLDIVKWVYAYLLAVLGTPSATFDGMRTCLYYDPNFLKLELSYGDHPRNPSNTECASQPLTDAYYTRFKDSSGRQQGYIAFCPRFFQLYKAFTDTNPSNFGGPWIERGCKNRDDEPSGNAARIVLHELIHWDLLTSFAYPRKILDISTEHPNGLWYPSYGAYYSMHVKDWPANGLRPLDNDENYVMLAWELYYQATYNLPDWQDPPPRPEWDEMSVPDPCKS